MSNTTKHNKVFIPQLRFPEFEEEWISIKIGEIGKPSMCKRIMKDQTLSVGDIPFYKIGTFGKEADAYISNDLYIEYKTKFSFPKKGDILISASGTIGRTVIYDGKPAFFQDSNIVWIANNEEKVLNALLVYSYENVRWSTENTTIARLYNDNLKNISIEVPSLPEQQKIASFLTDVDDKITKLTKKKTLLEQYKKGVMQKIFNQELRFKDDNGSAFPKWEEKQLRDVANYRRGSFPQPYGLPKWYDKENGIPFIQVYDVDDNMLLKPSTKHKISALGSKQSVFVEKGTLIITIQGSIGRIAKTQYDAYVDRTLLIFQSYKKPLNIDYFKYVLFLLFEIEKKKAPGGIIKTITKEVLSSFNVMIPVMEEQTKIANFLSDIDVKIEALNTKIENSKTFKKGLLQQMFV